MDRLALVGLIILAFIACGWAWLIATAEEDSEPDDDWELAEINGLIRDNMRKELSREQAGHSDYGFRSAGNSGSGPLLADSDRVKDDTGPETARGPVDCGVRE